MPPSYNPKRRKFFAIAIGAIIIAIVAMFAYVYKDVIVSLFSGADVQPVLTWGPTNGGSFQCLAPVRTTPNQSGGFVFDTEDRLGLLNKGPVAATGPNGQGIDINVALQIQTGPQDQGYQDFKFAANEVTVSTGTYADGIWHIPSIAVGAVARINLKRSNMPALPFNVSLSGGSTGMQTGCSASSYFSAPPAQSSPAPAATSTDITKETTTTADTTDTATNLPIVPIDIGDGDGDVTPPPTPCYDTPAEINTLGASYRVVGDQAVVKIIGQGCGKFTFGINGLGPAHELIPYDGANGQVPVKHQVFELSYGIHYLDLNVMDDPRLACGFQSDLYLPMPPAPAPIEYSHILAYDWAEHTCDDTPPPTTQNLVCAPATQAVATGTAANFTVTGGSAPYTWSTTGDNPTKPPVGASAAFTYGAAGNYTVTVEDSTTPTKKTATCAVSVSTIPPPPGQSLACVVVTQNPVVNSPVTFKATYSGQGLTYRWTAPGGTSTTGELSDTLTTTYTTTGPKTATVTVGGETATCNVTIAAAPIQSLPLVCTPQTQTTDVNREVTFNASGANGTYTWFARDGNPANGSGATFKTSFATPTRSVAAKVVTVESQTIETPTSPPVKTTADCNVTVNDVTVSQEQADLGIVKTTSNPTPELNGEYFWYTIVVSNLDLVRNVNGVSVRDVLPNGVTFVPITEGTKSSPSASQGTYNVADGVWTVGALNAGRGATLILAARANATGTHRNTSTITASSLPDPNPGNNEAFVDVIVSGGGDGSDPTYDIGVEKSVSNSAPTLNQNTEYTVRARNLGTATATNVRLRDVLPSGVTYVDHDTNGFGSYNEDTGIWTIGTMTTGGTATMHISFTPNTTGTTVNTVTLQGLDQTDSVSSNNEASASFTVGGGGGGGGSTPRADIAVTKSVNNSQPQLNQNVTFTIRAFNNGPRDATDVELRDLLPSGLVYVSHSASQGSYSQTTGVWAVGDIDDGDSETLTLTATATQLGTVVNTAILTDSSPNDPNDDNDQDSASVTVQSSGGSSGADLAVTKTVSNSTPAVGAQITYTINLVNLGPSAANNISVLDTLPSGLTFVKAETTLGSYNKNNGIWTVGSLSRGGSAVLQLTVTVNRVGTIINAARINGSDQPDSNSSNNESQVSITSHAAPGLPAAGLNSAAPIVIGFLFILLSIIVRFLGSMKPQTVLVDGRRSVNSRTRLD